MKSYALTIKTIVIHPAPWQVTPPYDTARHSAVAALTYTGQWVAALILLRELRPAKLHNMPVATIISERRAKFNRRYS